MLAEYLSTNTTIPTIVHKNNTNDYCEKIIESILTKTITAGLQRAEQKAVDQPTLINDTHKVVSLEKLSIKSVEQKAVDQPTVNNDT